MSVMTQEGGWPKLPNLLAKIGPVAYFGVAYKKKKVYNCRYYAFNPSYTLILAILGYSHILRTTHLGMLISNT